MPEYPVVALFAMSMRESWLTVRFFTGAPETERGLPSASTDSGYVGVSMYGRRLPSGRYALGHVCAPSNLASETDHSTSPPSRSSHRCHTTGAIS